MIPIYVKWIAVMGAVLALGLGIRWLDKARQEIGYQRAVAEYRAKLNEATNAARIQERDFNEKLQTATAAAADRETKLRAVSAAAATAGDRLRDALNTIRSRVPNDSAAAVRDTAGALADVFGECATEYRTLAEKADRHASDTMTFRAAWPTN